MNYIMQKLQMTDFNEQKNFTTLISEAYKSLTEIFLENQTGILPSYYKGDHSINLLKRITLSFKSIYNLSVKKLTVLQKYLNINLINRFIQPSQFSAEVLMLFTSKSDKGLQLYVDYCELNTIMQKN